MPRDVSIPMPPATIEPTNVTTAYCAAIANAAVDPPNAKAPDVKRGDRVPPLATIAIVTNTADAAITALLITLAIYSEYLLRLGLRPMRVSFI